MKELCRGTENFISWFDWYKTHFPYAAQKKYQRGFS
jgi:hypothetical protein